MNKQKLNNPQMVMTPKGPISLNLSALTNMLDKPQQKPVKELVN